MVLIPGRLNEFVLFTRIIEAAQNQGTNLSDSEIDPAYSEVANLMEDSPITMKNLWNILNMSYTKIVYGGHGKVKHRIIIIAR